MAPTMATEMINTGMDQPSETAEENTMVSNHGGLKFQELIL